VSEPTYTITITETERTAFAKVLGGLVTKLINAPIFVEAPAGGTQAARAVLSPPSTQRPANAPAPPAVVPVSNPIPEMHDRWQRDRKGHEVPWPKGCEEVERVIAKTEQKDKYLRVSWLAVGPNARGYMNANCFDQKLWPWLIKQTGTKTTMYLLKSDDGKFTNVVGLRA
jgi:hypothetical protein